jgi:hypothetical protein
MKEEPYVKSMSNHRCWGRVGFTAPQTGCAMTVGTGFGGGHLRKQRKNSKKITIFHSTGKKVLALREAI